MTVSMSGGPGWALSYQAVPKELEPNLQFRERVILACRADPALREGVKESCRRDLLFWVNTFLWTFDPRKIKLGQDPHIPFLTWEFQDETLLTLQRHIGHDDVGIEKSRDMGASWMCLVALLHQWQFLPGRTFMLVSRNERLVDAPTDPDSLFWKLDYLLKGQPPFLLPRMPSHRVKLHLTNLDNGNTIDGGTTTEDVGRGGRRTAMLIDEYGAFDVGESNAVNAATSSNTESRIFNSTYKSANGAFYDQMQRPDIIKISLHWTRHPEKAEGRTKKENGKWTSPWYEKMCQRIVSPALIAMELDMDPRGASSLFFPPDLLDRLLLTDVREPLLRGRIEPDGNNPTWIEDQNGPLCLWMWLRDGRPPRGESFVLGADISQGTGATNSVLTVADRRTGEKVGELALPSASPDRFAEMAVAAARLFNDGFLIWEMNGPGGPFGKAVIDLGYRNVYYRQDEQGLAKSIQASMVPGWHASTTNKELLLRGYVTALGNGGFINRSYAALQECRQYVYDASGHPANSRAATIEDRSGAKENHGDRVIADALACKALNDHGERPVVAQAKPRNYEEFLKQLPNSNPPYGSWAWRQKEALAENANSGQGLSRGWYQEDTLKHWQDPANSLKGQ